MTLFQFQIFAFVVSGNYVNRISAFYQLIGKIVDIRARSTRKWKIFWSDKTYSVDVAYFLSPTRNLITVIVAPENQAKALTK